MGLQRPVFPTLSAQDAVVTANAEEADEQAGGETKTIAKAMLIVRLSDIVDQRAYEYYKTEQPKRGGEIEAPQHVAPQGNGGSHESQKRTERPIVIVPEVIFFYQFHKHLSLCIRASKPRIRLHCKSRPYV